MIGLFLYVSKKSTLCKQSKSYTVSPCWTTELILNKYLVLDSNPPIYKFKSSNDFNNSSFSPFILKVSTTSSPSGL